MAAVGKIKGADIFGAERWAELSQRNDWLGVWLVTHAWLVIFAAGAMFIVWPNIITYLLAVLIIGSRQLGISILMHDGAHGLLLKRAKYNDRFAQMSTGFPLGNDMYAYRAYHLHHHRYAQQEEDPDLVLSAPFPITRESLKRKIGRDLTGQTFYRHRLAPLWQVVRKERELSTPERDFLLSQVVMLALCAVAGIWWAYFTLWLVPMATWFMLVTRFRNIAEHALMTNEPDPWRVARTTRASLLERAFIAPYWVNYHCEHHLFMWVPCYRLKAIHEALAAQSLTQTKAMPIAPGYAQVLREVSTA